MTRGANYPLSKRIALRLLRCYPRPWQRRYLAEMRALLEEIPVGWKETTNVAAIAVREWLSPRALGWPARTAAGRVLTLRGATFIACGYALDGLARVTAARLHAAGIAQNDSLGLLGAWLFVAVVLRLTISGVYTNNLTRPRLWRRSIPWWRQPAEGIEVLLCALLLVPMAVAQHLNPPESWESAFTRAIDPYVWVLQVWVNAFLLHHASARSWRLRRIEWARRPAIHV